MNIYVASSWRNDIQPIAVSVLRSAGHVVYDFKNPREGDNGFHWSELSPNWMEWTTVEYIKALEHPVAEAGFKSDFDAMKWADCFVGVMPFGRSASLEMGWACGQGKLTALVLADAEPELMVKMIDILLPDMEALVIQARKWSEGDDSKPDYSPQLTTKEEITK